MRRRILTLFAVCISILLVGCAAGATQTQTPKENKELIDPNVVDSALITSIVNENAHYIVSSEEAKELIATLKETDISDDEKEEDYSFNNTLVFYDKNGTQIVSIRTIDRDISEFSNYQLIVDNTLNQGKPYNSKSFYDKFNEIIKKNNYDLPDRIG